jgi:hypothetical protein
VNALCNELVVMPKLPLTFNLECAFLENNLENQTSPYAHPTSASPYCDCDRLDSITPTTPLEPIITFACTLS